MGVDYSRFSCCQSFSANDTSAVDDNNIRIEDSQLPAEAFTVDAIDWLNCRGKRFGYFKALRVADLFYAELAVAINERPYSKDECHLINDRKNPEFSNAVFQQLQT